jgi:hypothetical protein
MKAIVVTDKNGNIVGTARFNENEQMNTELRAIPLAGQKVYEIELPNQLQEFITIDELHSALQAHLPK